jgi:hypothetical protein
MTENKRTVDAYMEGFRRSDHARILLKGEDAFDREIENPGFVGSPAITVTRMTEENDVVVAEGSVRARKKDGADLKPAASVWSSTRRKHVRPGMS